MAVQFDFSPLLQVTAWKLSPPRIQNSQIRHQILVTKIRAWAARNDDLEIDISRCWIRLYKSRWILCFSRLFWGVWNMRESDSFGQIRRLKSFVVTNLKWLHRWSCNTLHSCNVLNSWYQVPMTKTNYLYAIGFLVLFSQLWSCFAYANSLLFFGPFTQIQAAFHQSSK